LEGPGKPCDDQDHKAGDKLYIDFAGVKLSIVDKQTGELTEVEVFVAILGASQLTYVEAVNSQQKEDLIAACKNTFYYIGGVPAAIVPDNLKAAVIKSNKYEPTLNEAFADFADHYGTTILPARAYRPRDKALVEGAVKIVYSRIYAPLRKQVYSSLSELNAAIWIALETHNNQLLRGRNYSRRLQFEEVERSALAPLPVLRYEFKKQLHATVMKNGHVCLSVDKHYYSVPYRFICKKFKPLFSNSLVEAYYHYERIALHKRVKSPYNYSTDKEHLASTHRFVTDWTPDRFWEWGSSIHEDVRLYIHKILEVGYQFQKHFGRGGNWAEAIPQGAKLNPATFNEAGFKTFKEIWRAPGSFEKVGNFIEKRLPDGRGIRLQQNWEFKGFLD
jgi:hypothetical protein